MNGSTTDTLKKYLIHLWLVMKGGAGFSIAASHRPDKLLQTLDVLAFSYGFGGQNLSLHPVECVQP